VATKAMSKTQEMIIALIRMMLYLLARGYFMI